jgi:DNA polymerase III subunit epsilon
MSAVMMHDDGTAPEGSDAQQGAVSHARPHAAPRMPTLAELGPRFEAFAGTLERPLVFFDIEATGADPIADRIIELSVVRVGAPPLGVEPPRTWRIDPGVKIPSEASDVHGIYNRDLVGAPSFNAVANEIAELFTGADLAGFSITRFDVRILQAEFVRAGRMIDFSRTRIIDAQVIYHQREPRNLAAALRFYRDRELHDAHGAQADTVASLEVLAGQLARYDDLELGIDALHAISSLHNDAYCDGQRRFSWRDREPVFNFGRLRGKSLRWVAGDPNERPYLRWMIDGNFDEDAKEIAREAMRGRIRRRAELGRA